MLVGTLDVGKSQRGNGEGELIRTWVKLFV